MKYALVVIATAITGLGVLFPIFFETSDWGLHYLDTHSFFARWPLMIVALVMAVISGGLANNWHDYKVKQLSETHAGETTWNPSIAWAAFSVVIQFIIIGLME